MLRDLTALLCVLVLSYAAPAQDPRGEFAEKIEKAFEFDDTGEADRVIKRDPSTAVAYFMTKCWQQRAKPEEKNAKAIEGMKAAWQRVFQAGTLDKIERYVSSRTESDQNLLYELETKEPQLYTEVNEAKAAKDRARLERARDVAKQLAARYEEVGHAMNASKAWGLASQISNEMPDRTLDDRRVAVDCVRNFLRTRELWEWTQDEHFVSNQVWLKSEEQKLAGVDEAAAGGGAGGGDAGATIEKWLAPGAEEQVATLEFAAVAEPHVDMFASGGAIPPLWLYAQVTKTGPTSFPRLTPAVFLVRPKPSKFGVTIDGTEADMKKNAWQEITPSAKFKASVFYRGADQTKPYAMWFYTAGEQEPLLGMNQNLMPQADSATVYYKSAASWVATIGGEQVTFYDDNANGQLFEEDPYAYGLLDRSRGDPKSGVPMPAFDSMRVGKGPPQPASSIVKIGEQWYYLRPQGEDKVGARALSTDAFKVGRVRMNWQGPRPAKPEILVLQGLEGIAGARYDASSGSDLEVPAGVYEIAFGRIVVGKAPRADQAYFFKGKSEPIAVKPGETKEFVLGAPFKLDFVRGGDAQTVEIDATKITVVGASGEEYARISVPPTPEVIVSKTADGKGARPVGEFVPMDLDNLDLAAKELKIGADAGFYAVPKGERGGKLVLKAPLPIEGGLVGLRQKKHKLFGSLEPIFK